MDASDLFGSVADISVDALLARLQKELDEWEEFLSDEDDAGDDEGMQWRTKTTTQILRSTEGQEAEERLRVHDTGTSPPRRLLRDPPAGVHRPVRPHSCLIWSRILRRV